MSYFLDTNCLERQVILLNENRHSPEYGLILLHMSTPYSLELTTVEVARHLLPRVVMHLRAICRMSCMMQAEVGVN